MQSRARETQKVMGLLPRPRSIVQAQVSASTGPVPRNATFSPCQGIDGCIEAVAGAAGVPLTFPTTDQEFLRRVRLDLTGRIPTRDEVLAFLADDSANKREVLVDRLLASDEWADRWAMFFGDLFRNTRVTAQVNRYRDTRDSFHLFLLESMRSNKPYDQMAVEMLTAQGVSDGRTYPSGYTSYEQYLSVVRNYQTNPVKPSAAAYVVGGRTTGGPIQDTYDTLAFITARDFLGISSLDCILCHDGAGHLDDLSVWGAAAKRQEAWGLAAFFASVPRYQTWRVPGRQRPVNPKNGNRVNPQYYILRDLAQDRTQRAGNGDTAGVYLAQTKGGNRPDRLHSQETAGANYPFAQNAIVPAGLRLRQQVGMHLTADPQFARAAVNYIWKAFFSRGIVEPADQFDLSLIDPASPPPTGWEIQPSHPYLLNWLAEGFRDSGFDLKWLMREITTSRTYQLSSRYDGAFNPLYDRYFVRHQVKRLSAEQMLDAVMLATGRGPRYYVSPTIRQLGFAMQFPDVRDMPGGRGGAVIRTLLQAFTPGDREGTPRSAAPGQLQALALMNNRYLLSSYPNESDTGTLAEARSENDQGLVTYLFLSALGRRPSADELSIGVEHLSSGDRNARSRDLFWAILNKIDFMYNY